MADDPTARTSGWWDSLFGEPQRHARQPQSRGALLGIAGAKDMPDTKSTITDQRQNDINAIKMADEARSYNWEDGWKTRPYDQSSMSGAAPATPMGGQDFFPSARFTANPLPFFDAADVAPYKPSFSQNMNPGRYQPPSASTQMGPQQQQNMGLVGQVAGPNDYVDNEAYSANYLPPIGAHLPIAPGDPRWTVPPSPSGPHNRVGDPNRPGFGGAMGPMGMTLNSVPQGW